jgi:hypothetical protein
MTTRSTQATQGPGQATVAMAILAQLGGNRFLAMTGARDLTSDCQVGSCSLSFRLPARASKMGITHCKVILEPTDTYTVVFHQIGRAPKFTVELKATISDVYAEDLRSVFESVTGLATSLGTMGGGR